MFIIDNVRLEKSASGINGSGDFFSMNKKIMNETAAKIKRPTIVMSPQFCLLLPVNNAYSKEQLYLMRKLSHQDSRYVA